MSFCDPARGQALIEDARVELVSSYDASDFPFQDLFRQMFQIQDDTELCNLHKMTLPEKAPLSLALMHGFTVAGHKCPKSWNKARLRKKERLKKFIASRAFQNFQRVFIRFVETVVVPLIGDPSGVVYQNPPTFRVQLPSNSPIGNPHKDADYDCHVDTEINIWVPVTDVWGSNTLHVESKPGLGDFHPLELRRGQLCRFWGNQCQHYTVANQTDATRVSFDFRVIPRSMYTGAFAGYIGDYPTRIARGPRAADAESLFQRALALLSLDDGADNPAQPPAPHGISVAAFPDPAAGVDTRVAGVGVESDPLAEPGGEGVAVSATDAARAGEYLAAAAALGHIAAEGVCWEHGLGRPTDLARALACLTLEAEQGHSAAQYLLACTLSRHPDAAGAGVGARMTEGAGAAAEGGGRAAVGWWRKAAKQGHAGAARRLQALGEAWAARAAAPEAERPAAAAAAEAKE